MNSLPVRNRPPPPPHFNLLDLPTVWWWGMSVAGFRFKHNANSDTQTVSLTERCLVKVLPFKTSYSAVFFYFIFLNVLFICKHLLIGHARADWVWIILSVIIPIEAQEVAQPTFIYLILQFSYVLKRKMRQHQNPSKMTASGLTSRSDLSSCVGSHNMHTPITDTNKSTKKKRKTHWFVSSHFFSEVFHPLLSCAVHPTMHDHKRWGVAGKGKEQHF